MREARRHRRRAGSGGQHLYEPPYGGWEFTIRDLNGFELNFLGQG